jgi:signal transduction histidine kinase
METSSDELGELANAFNLMSDGIEQAIEETSDRNAYLDAVLQEMFGGVMAIDAEGFIVIINTVLAEWVGISQSKSKGQVMSSVGLPAVLVDAFELAKEKQRVVHRSISLSGEDEIDMQCAPIHTQTGEAIGYLMLLFDVTEKKQMIEQQRAFFTNVSHEVRTPLTSIQGFIETLEQHRILKDQDMDQIVEILSVEAMRLDTLIKQMLEIGNLGNKTISRQTMRMSIDLAMDDIIDQYQNMALSKGVSLAASRYIKGEIVTDPEAFRVILSNLVSNAIKYTPPGGTVTLQTEYIGSKIHLKVSDTGIGIAATELSMIFDKFYRCDKSRNSSVPGYGLGLAIVKSLCEELGIRIFVDSEINKGTSFELVMDR